jgi:cytoskeletal protein CcmA (bactofilin family)
MTPPLHGLLLLLACLLPLSAPAQEAGDTVQIRGARAEDVYAAGGTVDIMADVEGDVVAAGGRVIAGERISGDVLAAGGSVNVRATVGDDVRVAGGDVTLEGSIGGDAIAAGGSVLLLPGGTVGGRAWFSGGRVDVGGEIGRELRAAGGRIVLSGRVHGDVELSGRSISLLEGTVIDGDLLYRSPREAEIAEGAIIHGTVRHEPAEHQAGAVAAAVTGAGLLVLLGLLVTGILLFLLFPRVIAASVTTIRTRPWTSLGLGLALFTATPLVISLLFMTLIGWLPALVTGALYLLLLPAGFLTGTFFAGGLAAGLRKRGELSRTRWLWAFAIALCVVLLLGLIPLLGQLLLLALMLLGTGALALGLYRRYTGTQAGES